MNTGEKIALASVIIAIISLIAFIFHSIYILPPPTPASTPTPAPTPTPASTPTPAPTPTPASTPTYTPPNNPPAAFVDSINPSPALQGQSVTFTCHGNDPDSGDYITEYRWESSIDGFLSDQKTFSTSSLASGSHEIILRVEDSYGQWSSEVTRNLKVEVIKIPSAEIKYIWVEHNVWEGYLYGMKIHFSFDIHNLKGEDCSASAYFYLEDGEPLYDFNQQYCTIDGKVSSGIDFEPIYVDTTFSDLYIFLPYNELHMAPGEHNLMFSISIWYGDAELDQSDPEYFPYIQPY